MTLGLGQWLELGDDKLLVKLPGVGAKYLTEVKVIIGETARHESGRYARAGVTLEVRSRCVGGDCGWGCLACSVSAPLWRWWLSGVRPPHR